MFGSQSVLHLNQPEGAFVLNLSKFQNGPQAALNRIPERMAGVYSWFRTFRYPDAPEALFERLMEDLLSVKFQARTGAIKPFYEVAISSKSWIGEEKKERVRRALNHEPFRRGLLDALSISVLFQAPLYVGKSSNLRRRIRDHLKANSPLRTRLKHAEIDMDQSMILIVPSPEQAAVSEDHGEDMDAADENLPEEEQYEDLYEEIFSRLFNPLFTIRLG